MKYIKGIYSFLCGIEENVSMFCLMSSTLILCAGAVCRTLGYPLPMISDISLCLFAWCVFLGADAAYRNNKLVFVELIINEIRPKFRRILYGINYGIIFTFLVFFTAQSIRMASFSWVRKWASIPTLSYGYVALSIPVGCSFMIVTTIIQFYKYVIKGEDKVSESEELTDEKI